MAQRKETQHTSPLDAYIGQSLAKRMLEVPLAIAEKQGKPLPTYLLDWPTGHGKNEFHHTVASMLGVTKVVFNVAEGKKALGRILFDAEPNCVLLFDEAHNMNRGHLTPCLLTLLEERRFMYSNGENLLVPNMTFMLATTQGYKIPSDILSRVTELPYEAYSDADIANLFIRFLPDMENIGEETVQSLVRISLFEPRMVRTISDRVRDRLSLDMPIDVAIICNDLGLSPDGLTQSDRRILEFIRSGFVAAPRQRRPSEIASFLKTAVSSLPYYLNRLMRLGFIDQNESFVWTAIPE